MECVDNSGCSYLGQFANGEVLTFEQVKSRPLVAFFARPQSGRNVDTSTTFWERNYENRWITVTATVIGLPNPVVFDAQIVDTCGDWDCDDCCTKNINYSGVDYLVDVEEQTRLKYFGTRDLPDTVKFQFR